MNKIYTLLAESSEPVFDLEELNLPGGTNILVVTASDGTNETEYSDEVQYEQEYKNCSIKKSTLTSIADRVRGKTGKTEPILTENIPAEIDSILVPDGTKPETITENGEGIDVAAYEKVNVNVSSRTPMLQEKTVSEDGVITPDSGYDGLSKVTVDVVKSNTTKRITANGTYSTSLVSPYSGVAGYVEVDVPIPDSGKSVDTTKTLNITLNNQPYSTSIDDFTVYGYAKAAIPEFDGIIEKEPGVFSELVFLNSPDVTIDLSDDMQFWTPDGVLWTGIRVDATNKQIYYVDPVDGPIVKYTESGGWVNDVHDKITVHVYGTDYYPNEYTYRGWLAANTIRQLPYAYASYNGEVIDVGTSQVIIPCKGKVMATDIIIYNDQNKP